MTSKFATPGTSGSFVFLKKIIKEFQTLDTRDKEEVVKALSQIIDTENCNGS